MAQSAQKVKDKVYWAIKNSNEIKEGNYVSVAVEKSGFLFFGSSKLVLTGRTTSEKDKEKIESIARENAGEVEIESRLRVGKTS
jgi:TATA-box binding protein (TBP) (component of TFIID and TFIIIB)